MKKLTLLGGAALLALGIGMSGCTTVGNVATNMSTSTPQQVSTYEDATLAATLATNAVDFAVNNVNLTRPQLVELRSLNDAVHAAWLNLKADRDAKRSLVFGSFNAALAAFDAYKNSQNIPDAPASNTPAAH